VTNSAPLIIGATGGSGTRIVARLARHAGYDLGAHLNEAEDALEFYSFHDRWINRFTGAQRRGKALSKNEAAQMKRDFQDALARHLSRWTIESGARWGWKAPRSVYLLPFLHIQFPKLKFIHVLRDGRDMAFSKNRNQLRKHGRAVLNWCERWFCPLPVRSLLLWERVNLRAAEYSEAQLRENYHRVRFEDLCQAPIETSERILKFLEANVDTESFARSEISPPASIGRWRGHPAPLLARMDSAAAISLRKFDYLK
jgi:sulfotransferase family protein